MSMNNSQKVEMSQTILRQQIELHCLMGFYNTEVRRS